MQPHKEVAHVVEANICERDDRIIQKLRGLSQADQPLQDHDSVT